MTVKFNKAWCLEYLNSVETESELYKAIIAEEPTYTDAYLRLSRLAKLRGDSRQALEYVDQAKENHIKKPGY